MPTALQRLVASLYCHNDSSAFDWWHYGHSQQDLTLLDRSLKLPLAGFCATTQEGGNCSHDDQGSFIGGAGSESIESCALQCFKQKCTKCNFVSNSQGLRDCSWYANCDIDAEAEQRKRFALHHLFRTARVSNTSLHDWQARRKATRGLSTLRPMRWAPPAEVSTMRPEAVARCLGSSAGTSVGGRNGTRAPQWLYVAGDSFTRDFFHALMALAGAPLYGNNYPTAVEEYWPAGEWAPKPPPSDRFAGLYAGMSGADIRGESCGADRWNISKSCTRDEVLPGSGARISFHFYGATPHVEDEIAMAHRLFPPSPPCPPPSSHGRIRSRISSWPVEHHSPIALVSCPVFVHVSKNAYTARGVLQPQLLPGQRTGDHRQRAANVASIVEVGAAQYRRVAAACRRYVEGAVWQRWPRATVYLLGLPDLTGHLSRAAQANITREINAAFGISCSTRSLKDSGGDSGGTSQHVPQYNLAVAAGTRGRIVPIDRRHIGGTRRRDDKHPVVEVQFALAQLALNLLCRVRPRPSRTRKR